MMSKITTLTGLAMVSFCMLSFNNLYDPNLSVGANLEQFLSRDTAITLSSNEAGSVRVADSSITVSPRKRDVSPSGPRDDLATLHVDEENDIPVCNQCVPPAGYESKTKVPKLVHFVWLHKGKVSFGITHHLAIKAARMHIRPTCICLHVHPFEEPEGEWWNKTRPYVSLVPARDVTEVFGNAVVKPYHKADILRIEILRKFGGIYLDTDVIALKSFDPLLQCSFAIGRIPKKTLACAAVLFAEPGAPFLERWYAKYRTFKSFETDAHSGKDSLALAVAHPEEATVLPDRYFHYPSWRMPKELFVHNDRNFTRNYALHLWSNAYWNKYISLITAEDIKTRDTNLNRHLRPILLARVR